MRDAVMAETFGYDLVFRTFPPLGYPDDRLCRGAMARRVRVQF
jgi:hypothetical protein